MSGFFEENRERRRRETDGSQGHSFNSEDLRVLGKISRLFFQGKQLYPPPESLRKDSFSKKKRPHFIIIPVKDKNSVVEFVKIPMFKAEKKVKAKPKGVFNIEGLNFPGYETAPDKQNIWVADKSQLQQPPVLQYLQQLRQKQPTSPPVQQQRPPGQPQTPQQQSSHQPLLPHQPSHHQPQLPHQQSQHKPQLPNQQSQHKPQLPHQQSHHKPQPQPQPQPTTSLGTRRSSKLLSQSFDSSPGEELCECPGGPSWTAKSTKRDSERTSNVIRISEYHDSVEIMYRRGGAEKCEPEPERKESRCVKLCKRRRKSKDTTPKEKKKNKVKKSKPRKDRE